MKRLLTHPALPLILGIVAISLAGLVLLFSVLFPDLFTLRVVEAPRAAVANVIQAVIPQEEESTTAVPASYVLDTRDRLITERATFVEADLTAMQLKVYKEGVVVVDVPIKSKGKVGSWWETPVGVYSVKNKETNHFSSFGHVYQPWSLVFQGNFFIHGWPYYPDGAPVSSQYSGGCIRLADEHAKQVFDAVSIGAPVLVYKQQEKSEPVPAIAGKPATEASYAVVTVNGGDTIRSRSAGEDVPLGSVVNLLTALTVVDYMNVERDVRVDAPESERLAGRGSVSVLDLLRLLLSEGDPAAAKTLATHRGEALFVQNMNAKAAAIGMAHTKITSVHPEDMGNRTTVADVALLARYLAENRSFVLQLTQSARGNLAYDPPLWSDLKFDTQLKALPGLFGGLAETVSGAPAVAVLDLTIRGNVQRVVITVTDATDPMKAVEEIATWLTTS